MSYTWFEFILIGLSVFRLTHLFLYDKITESLRTRLLMEQNIVDEDGNEDWNYIPKGEGIKKFIGELFVCHWCMSVWISAGMLGGYLLFPQIFIIIIYLFAIAAFAVIIEEIVLRYL
ncbi:DUF1360 domain-containing protein [Salipaludibacillus daqingensis]|uniref:DUF1360 domain-containing protein n=1 Tax=Salipaludibacillus daqingensis TaxID=3041001 RepID=UPI002474D639|nr:DUF1360 domain-containing protein [Salipaludibacillus daqingensis]